RPVRALVLLIELDPEIAFEQRGQPEGLEPEELRGYARVENVDRAPGVILVQQPEIVVGIVEDLLDVGVLEEAAESGRRADRERVDDRAPLASRELQQVNSIDEAVEARALGVEG